MELLEAIENARRLLSDAPMRAELPILSAAGAAELMRRQPCGHLVYHEHCSCESIERPEE